MLLRTFMYKYLCRHKISFLLPKYLRVEWQGHMVGKCIFNYINNCKIIFQSDCHILHSHQQYEGSNFSISLPAPGIVSLSNFRHFSGCIVISCYDLNLHFPND